MKKWEVAEPRGTVVMVHGAGEHHGRYEWLAAKWNMHGFNVIMGDLPGQGKSRGHRGHIRSFNQYLDVVEEWLAEARLSRLPIILFGHSMGGLVVIRTLMERKIDNVQCVILSSPCLGLYQPPARAKELTAKLVHRLTPTLSANSGIRVEHVTRNEDIREAYLRDELRVRRVSVRWYQELSKAMRLSHRYPEKFPQLPLLVMQAGDDLVVNKSDVIEWFNQLYLTEKAYKEWEGLYHEIFNEPEREDVFTYALAFVDLHF